MASLGDVFMCLVSVQHPKIFNLKWYKTEKSSKYLIFYLENSLKQSTCYQNSCLVFCWSANRFNSHNSYFQVFLKFTFFFWSLRFSYIFRFNVIFNIRFFQIQSADCNLPYQENNILYEITSSSPNAIQYLELCVCTHIF